MNTRFSVKASDFNELLFEKIKSLLNSEPGLEVTISIRTSRSNNTFKNESKEEYFERLTTAKNNLDNNINAVSFTATEFEAFKKELLKY